MISFFKEQAVLALTGDASVDFTPRDFDAPLTSVQAQYLKAHTGKNILKVFWCEQVHGDKVLVTRPEVQKECAQADAYITDQKNWPIAIRTADCVPVFIYDPVKEVMGLVHAGWKGTQLHIVAKTVLAMQKTFASRSSDLMIALGPSIRSCCYEVGEEFKTHFPQDCALRNGKLYVDTAAANQRQLVEVGVLAHNIFDCGICTFCQPGYFSFRRDAAKAGRMISLMMLK